MNQWLKIIAVIVIVLLVVFVIYVGYNALTQQPGKGFGGLTPFPKGLSGETIYPSYFEIVKNATSSEYYVYVILTNEKSESKAVEAQMNFTFKTDDKILWFSSFNVSSHDYRPYYSRITNKYIGDAFILPVPRDAVNASTGYFTMILDAYIPSDKSEKIYHETRVVKVANIPEVK
jgi:hypothetical protein